jgi:prevent-host-death family protein
MKTIGSRELRTRLGRYLRLVRKGETIVVTNRGRVVARLVPLASEKEKPDDLDNLLSRLEAEGHLRLAKGPFGRREFKPIVTRGKPASRIILEDRD